MIERLELPRSVLVELKDKLDYEAFGVAIALVLRHIETGEGYADDERIHKSLKLHSARWRKLRPDLLIAFRTQPGARFEHPMVCAFLQARSGALEPIAVDTGLRGDLAEQLLYRCVKTSGGMKPLFERAPVNQAPRTIIKRPTQSSREQPVLFGPRTSTPEQKGPAPAASLVASQQGLVVQLALSLFGHLGEERARRLVGSMLRDYAVPYVVRALETAMERRGGVADPVSFVKRALTDYPTKEEERANRFSRSGRLAGSQQVRREVEKNPSVRPDLVDVSDKTASRLKKLATQARRSLVDGDG